MRSVLSLLALLVWSSAEAQPPPIFLSHTYGPEQGLSNRHVTALIQDHVGYIWAGTVSGLDRFDGHSFRNWSLSDGLSGARVSALRRDTKGDIWVFCDSHKNDITNLDILDPTTGSLRGLQERFPELPFKPKELIRYGPQQDDGTIILGARSPARCILYTATNGFTVIALEGERFEPLGRDGAGRIIGHLVLDEGRQQVVRVDADGRTEVVHELIPGSAVEPLVTGRTSRGALYRVASPDRVLRYYDTYSEVDFADHARRNDDHRVRSGDPIHRPLNYTPLPERGLRMEGTRVLDGTDKVLFDLAVEHPEVMGRLKGCLVDRNGGVWVATEFGLHHIEMRKDVFRRILYKNDGSLMGLLCRGMAMNGNELCLSTEWQGGYVLKMNGDEVGVETQEAPLYLFASHVAQDGTWWRGGTNVVVSRTPQGNSRTYAVADEIWNILTNVEGEVLLGGLHGMHLLDPKTGTERSWNDPRHPELEQTHVMQLQHLPDGTVLATTSKGLYQCGPGGHVVRRWWTGGTGRDHLPYHDLHHCYIDADGLMWLSTRGTGLVCFDPRTGRQQEYTMRNGFPNNMVYAAYEDDNGQLWLPTDGGIVRFDKRSRQSTVFTTADGITNDEFNRLAHTRGPDGTLYFGGLNGITAFHPDAFAPVNDRQRAPVVLTRFERYSAEQGGLVDRLAETTTAEGITLSAEDRSIRLSFAMLSYEGSGRTLYAWRLAGVEDDWNYQLEPTLRLDRLPFGRYVLEVKARDGLGTWSGRQLELPITVEQPWHAHRALWVGLGALVVILPLLVRWYLRRRATRRVGVEASLVA